VRRYLEPLAAADVDVVVLGCTHYPLLRPIIEAEVTRMLGPDALVVDSAHAVAEEARDFLRGRELARKTADGGSIGLCVTDMPKSFADVASRFLGHEVPEVELIDL